MRRFFSNTIRALFLAISVVVLPAACFAWCGAGGWHDGHTRYMWSRTFHGPNALATPLNEYFIPRTPNNCGPATYGCGAGCQEESGIACNYGGLPYPTAAAAGFDPVQMERLGRVPNELDIVGVIGPVAPGAAPPAAPRR